MSSLGADELEDELFLALLKLSRSGGGPEFDLQAVCRDLELAATPQELLSFTADNDGWRGEKNNTLSSIRFTMNAEGRRHALELEKSRKPKSWRDRWAEVPVGKGLWDLVKIGLGFGLGLLAHKFTGS